MRSLIVSLALGAGALFGLAPSTARAQLPGGYVAGYEYESATFGAYGRPAVVPGPVVGGGFRAGRIVTAGPTGVRSAGGIVTPRVRAGYYRGPVVRAGRVSVRPGIYRGPVFPY